jgi:filamentous hemagglutinin family protein
MGAFWFCRISLLATLSSISVGAPAWAQSVIVPDDTLGAESSQVIPNAGGFPAELIQGGAIRGQNLFHSFEEFNVDEGREAYFVTPSDAIINIFSRVTGENPSNIFGVLGAFSFNGSNTDANLFLMNPNGIIFGGNSSVDLTGSFASTTADAIRFGNGGIFSATVPEVPSDLLTIDPSSLLYNQIPTSTIIHQGALAVEEGQSLILVGGDVVVDGGFLGVNFFEGGRIELGAVAQIGEVEFVKTGNLFGLDFPDDLERADISLINGSALQLSTENLGSVAISGRNINVSDSQIQIGVFPRLDSSQSLSGAIILDASQNIRIESNSLINNLVFPDAVGDAGNINIAAAKIFMERSQISSSTLGQGNAGNITIQSDLEVALDDSNIFSLVVETAEGNAGDIVFKLSDLVLENGAQISASSFGEGNPGDVSIHAMNHVSLDGFPSAIFSSVFGNSITQGGDINIITRDFSLTNSAKLDTSVFGQGQGGNIIIDAENSVSIGGILRGEPTSSIFSTVEDGGTGTAGDIYISTGSLSLIDGGNIQSLVRGQGDAGDIFIQAQNSVVIDGSVIQDITDNFPGIDGVVIIRVPSSISSAVVNDESTSGSGGDILIQTEGDIYLSNSALIESNIVSREAVGDAGDITLIADSLFIDNASVRTNTLAQGNAGDILINVRDQVLMKNQSQLQAFTDGLGDAGSVSLNAGNEINLRNDSVVFSTVEENGIGSAGSILINTDSLLITNGSQVIASTLGQGDAGDILIRVGDQVLLQGRSPEGFFSGILTVVSDIGTGNGGGIDIDSTSVFLIDHSVLSATTFGVGNAGTISISSQQLSLINDSSLLSDTFKEGNAGDILLNISGLTSIVDNSRVSTAVNENARGSGGTITVSTSRLILQDRASISTESLGQGTAGNVFLNAAHRIQLNDSDIVTVASQSSGGNIAINQAEGTERGLVVLFGDSDITTESFGDGGNITIGGAAVIAFDDSDIVARSQSARGGNIVLTSFFSETLPPDNQPPFDGDGQVDVNADGQLASGVISSPDTSFIENSVSNLPEVIVDTSQLLSGSCIARANDGGSFVITGREGLPNRPGDAIVSAYATGQVRTAENQAAETETTEPIWQSGDPIIEPQAAYRLADGRLVLSRECP